MLTDRNSDELREINKIMTGADMDRMTSDKWLSSTGGLVTPLGDMDNFAISVSIDGARSRSFKPSDRISWYIVVEDDMYYLYDNAENIRSGYSGIFHPIKQESVYKFPFKLTRDDKKIINSMLLQLDNLYLVSNNFLYVFGHYPDLFFQLPHCDAMFKVIYNKVLEGRLERGDNARPRTPRTNRIAEILAQLNEATNEVEIKELQKEYNRIMRGMMGGKTRKRK